MSPVTTNYRIPVQVNGFECKNCTDVDYAKRHIDPAHPHSGPYSINAATDTSRAVTAALSPTGTILNASA